MRASQYFLLVLNHPPIIINTSEWQPPTPESSIPHLELGKLTQIHITKGKQTIFVTNNSTQSRAQYHAKLTRLHLPSSPTDVFSSSYSAAVYISLILRPQPPKNKVFILGESGIETELREAGIPFCGGTDASLLRDTHNPEDFKKIASGEVLDPEVGVVLCGLDFHLNYLKLSLAYHYIVKQNATFLATNSDSTFPNAGSFFPGAGACTAPLIEMLGGRKPISLGKPDPAMMQAVEGKLKFDKKRACMVGDRLDTDIKFGVESGLGGTLAVLTGVTRGKEEWEMEGGDVRPAYWVDKLGDLVDGT